MIATPSTVGSFRWSRPSDHWWWSDALFSIHGLTRGDVAPTREILLWHVHPEDADLVDATLTASWDTDVGCDYRLIDLEGSEHQASLAAAGSQVSGARTTITGLVTDATVPRLRAISASTNAQLGLALESRTAVDQAKGVLMLEYGMDADAAFGLLRSASQERNMRVRVLADRIVRGVADAGGLPSPAREQVDDLVLHAMDDQVVHRAPPATTVVATLARDARGDPILTVSGIVDLGSYRDLTPRLDALALSARDTARAVLDLQAVSYLGSGAAASIGRFQRRSGSCGIDVTVVLPGGGVVEASAHHRSRSATRSS
ncbi:ANTAR domain-containing protein [Cellulomonas sp.]|uniref:ANTAR domain-containing protein n=1 Tax=Cellulomonas sp. TaxID=40001 RepID=UPI003BABC4C1